MSKLPPTEIRGYEPGDEVRVVETFNEVFGAEDPGFVPRTLDYWRWMNLANPSGMRLRMAVAEDGRIAGHVGGIAQRVRYRGEPGTICQSVDGFSHPAWRRALMRQGAYAPVLNDFIRHYTTEGARDHVVWGLPVPAAWRIGQAFCHEKLFRTQNKLVAGPEALLALEGGDGEVEDVLRFPPEMDQLFERCVAPEALIAVRDAAQLNWRFADHPLHSYRIGLAREADRIAGYACFRRGVFDGSEDALVCDWLVERESPAAARALLAWLGRCAREEGLERVTTMLPDTIPEWLELQRIGFRVRPTRYFTTGYMAGRLTQGWLHRHWYYTLGDTDLC